jgi:Brp/Blh family beta-carotene 15,15'-monooxygenase
MLAHRTELRWPPAAVALAALLLLAALVLLDRGLPHAGLLTLLILVGTVGTAHGVLDTLLIVRHLPTPRSRWWVATAYLLAALVTAAGLQGAPAVALMVLLGLSLWHFGEHFDSAAPGADKSSPLAQLPQLAQQLVTRLLRGGAPVLMPALVAQAALAPQAQVAAGSDPAATAMLWLVWTGMAYAWLALFGVWCLLWLLRPLWSHLSMPSLPLVSRMSLMTPRAQQSAAASRRHLLLEVLAIALLYTLLSPLMAFAVYFGGYHATGHIRRVLRTTPAGASAPWHKDWRLLGTLALTLFLGLALVAWMLPQTTNFALPDVALRSVILALAAVSVPHVLLIGWWAHGLRARPGVAA